MDNKKVFVVHGHDHQLLQEVELMLRRIGLEPIILKNEANAGRTIIKNVLIDLTQQVTISCNSPKYRTASMR